MRRESEEDFIEYKLRLDTKTDQGLNKTLHQINRRLNTAKQLIGNEIAHYVLGVKDNGDFGDILKDNILETFTILNNLVTSKKINAFIYSKHEYIFDSSYICYVIVHKKNDIKFKEYQVAFIGPSESGKTTIISHLLYGTPKKIELIFKHEHEKVTGITTTIKKETIGIKNNNLINYKSPLILSTIDIAIESDYLINIYDYPGNITKIKTVFHGLLSNDNNLS